MFKDGMPTHTTGEGEDRISLPAAGDEQPDVQDRADLFEDILDVEEVLRRAIGVAPQTVNASPDTFDRGLAVLEGRIPAGTSLELQAVRDAWRAAAKAGDGAARHAAQEAGIAILVALRQAD